MERLGELITREVQNGNWIPCQISKGGPRVSHLFFADDVLLFAKAKPSQVQLIANILKKFCMVSGLKVSLEKSRAFASKGVGRRRKEKITSITQITFTQQLGKYLGFKMLHGRPKKQDFEDVVDRVTSKLASWKGRLLNKPGRVVLANSVLAALPSYGMQLCWYPQSICDFLDETTRSFIWKGNIGRGIHMVGWTKITKPRAQGGLGVRQARPQNIALLGKRIWELQHAGDKLWVAMLRDKYVKNGNIFQANSTNGSPTWTAIMKALEVLKDGWMFK